MFIKKYLLYLKLLAGISIYFLIGIVHTGYAVTTEWTMDFEPQKIVMVPVGGIVVPIETAKSTIALNHNERGRFSITNGSMRSVTRTPVLVTGSDASTIYNKRPTLFVTVQGYTPDPNIDGWQQEVITQTGPLDHMYGQYYSQYMGFSVDWDSTQPMRRQVKGVAGLINQYLNGRAYPWDVVLVGFSRGGIFAHELAKKIAGNANINNLHSFLLDPTAVGFFADFYPREKFSVQGKPHYGSLFYDGDLVFPANLGNSSLTIESDHSITGYSNYGLGESDYLFISSSHQDFAQEWTVNSTKGFQRALANIWASKDPGTFLKDGKGGWDIVNVHEKDMFIDGNVDIIDGKLYVDGMLVVGLNQASFAGTFGVDTIDFAVSVFSTSAVASIKADEAMVAANTELGTVAASISAGSVTTYTNMFGAETTVNADPTNFSLSQNILGNNVSMSTSLGKSVNIKIGNSRIRLPGPFGW